MFDMRKRATRALLCFALQSGGFSMIGSVMTESKWLENYELKRMLPPCNRLRRLTVRMWSLDLRIKITRAQDTRAKHVTRLSETCQRWEKVWLAAPYNQVESWQLRCTRTIHLYDWYDSRRGLTQWTYRLYSHWGCWLQVRVAVERVDGVGPGVICLWSHASTTLLCTLASIVDVRGGNWDLC